MSTNENARFPDAPDDDVALNHRGEAAAKESASLPEGTSKERAMAVHRSALAEPQESAWAAATPWTEPALPTSMNLSLYLHGLRRHWVLATAVGLLCAVVAGSATWLLYGPQYTYTAGLQVASYEPALVFEKLGSAALSQRGYDVFKNTQIDLMKSPFVLLAALRKDKVRNLTCVRRENDPVTWLEDGLEVGFPGQSEIMVVRMTGEDPEEVTVLVQEVVTAYMDEVVNKEKDRRKYRLSELQTVYTENERELRTRMAALKDLAETMGTSDTETLSLKQRQAVQQFAEYQRQMMQAEFALMKAGAEQRGQQALLDGLPGVEISESEVDALANNDPLVRQLASQLSYQEWDVEYTKETATGNSPHVDRFQEDYKRTLAQLQERRESLRQQIRGVKKSEIEDEIRRKIVEVNALTEQVSSLTKTVKEKEDEVKRIGGRSVEIEMMRARVGTLDEVLSGIAKERETLEVENRAASRITPLPPAEKPRTPDNLPLRVTVTVLAMLAGLCVPLAGIVWWDTRAKRINTAAEVSKNLRMTVLGSVPKIPAQVIRRLGSPSKRSQSWQMRLTESVDGIAARLLRKAALEQTRVILVSSAVGSEGKTTLATQLAMSLARNGRDTVLVDFDLRRPAFNEIFGLPLEPGVSEALRGEANLDLPVHATGTDNLSVVTAGRWDRHALAALANGAAAQIFERLRAEHEFVVVDASPILPVADTRFVSQHVDTVVLSVFRDVSQAPKVEAACEILEAFGVDSLEAVVTGSSEALRERDMGYEPRLSA